jgi:hypothetical protein
MTKNDDFPLLGSKPDRHIFENLLLRRVLTDPTEFRHRRRACAQRFLIRGYWYIFVRVVYVEHCFYDGISSPGTNEKLPSTNLPPLIFFKTTQNPTLFRCKAAATGATTNIFSRKKSCRPKKCQRRVATTPMARGITNS